MKSQIYLNKLIDTAQIKTQVIIDFEKYLIAYFAPKNAQERAINGIIMIGRIPVLSRIVLKFLLIKMWLSRATGTIVTPMR